jgi:hypothetical protein
MFKMFKLSLFVVIVAGSVGLTGCTSPQDAEKALNAEGMTNIKVTGYKFFACSRDDFYNTGFTATNSVGKNVEGTVCSGLFFKGSTIRY